MNVLRTNNLELNFTEIGAAVRMVHISDDNNSYKRDNIHGILSWCGYFEVRLWQNDIDNEKT